MTMNKMKTVYFLIVIIFAFVSCSRINNENLSTSEPYECKIYVISISFDKISIKAALM